MSGFGARPAVVVVDLIRGFTDPTFKLGSNYDSVVEEVTQLLSAARDRDIPIAFTTVMYENPDEAGAFVKKIPALRLLTPDSPWVQLDPRLGRRQSELLIIKKFASAFFGTPLTSMLTAKRVDTVIVAGVTTSGCVRATAVDALQHGYNVVVPRQCVGDRAVEPHNANLFDLNAKYADVVEMNRVIDYIKSRQISEP